jgi:hypothetical protein
MTYLIAQQRYLLSSDCNHAPCLPKPSAHLARDLSVQPQASSHTTARTQHANIAVPSSLDAMHVAIAPDTFASYILRNLRILIRTLFAVPARNISRDKTRGENMNGGSMAFLMLNRTREGQ